MTIETFSVLALSTVHVTKEVNDALEALFDPLALSRDPNHWTYWVVGTNHDYGWWIWADLDMIDALPPCLRSCLLLARVNGCRYVMFDADVAPLEELTEHAW